MNLNRFKWRQRTWGVIITNTVTICTLTIASFPGLPPLFILQAIKAGDTAGDEATLIIHR